MTLWNPDRMELEPDTAKAHRRLTVRERVGIKLLMLIFTMVYPLKYGHKMDALWELLSKLDSEG